VAVLGGNIAARKDDCNTSCAQHAQTPRRKFESLITPAFAIYFQDFLLTTMKKVLTEEPHITIFFV
jgi:hypothetical protein